VFRGKCSFTGRFPLSVRSEVQILSPRLKATRDFKRVNLGHFEVSFFFATDLSIARRLRIASRSNHTCMPEFDSQVEILYNLSLYSIGYRAMSRFRSRSGMRMP